ncbi:MAG: PQQ-binding-like beta-propeller repeat protein [Anaerolineaceae bacterium]|nr:PQQ-binding-like beta-propeller repeat protein [Anaerolineaceae bacterium]
MRRFILPGLLIVVFSWVSTLPVMGQSASAEWAQDIGNAQRTGYTSEEPLEPWTLLWTWNGANANGTSAGHFYDAPSEARTVTGGAYIYAPAGGSGLYALGKQNGQVGWHLTATSFNATPAYEIGTGYLFAGGADGRLYKIDANTGNVAATYNAGNPLNKPMLLVNGFAYVATDNGQLHKVSTATMQAAWVYSANAPIATPPSYSATRDMIVYATNDLYVHGVNNSNGTQKWRVKPSPNTAGFPNEMDGMWPVIAEQHGVVFVRMRLDHNAGLWGGPGPGGMYPGTNAETRSFLQSHPQLKNLFALNLDNGAEAFIPAVGYGGPEAVVNGTPYLDVGPVPVVRTYPNGDEVAYMIFRSSQGNPPDGRWDSHMGEMVLDSNTVPGMVAGDLRFISFPNSYLNITDEQGPFSMAGNTLFRAHWGALETATITNRADNLGLTYASSIPTSTHPRVIRRMQTCNSFNPTTHWTTCGLTLYNDGRYWQGPGWWAYWNDYDPPESPSRGAYSAGILPGYAYVNGGLIVLEGNGGDLMVFRHSGTAAPAPTAVPTSPGQPTTVPTSTLAPTNTPFPTAQPTLVPTNTPFPPAQPTQSAGTPQVTAIAANAGQVGRYDKYEVTFQISKSYPADSMLPYYYYDPSDSRGIDGITIDGHFIAPSGREMVVPAFYHQEYRGTGTSLTATSNFSWKLRFAPQEVGGYNYYITITDRNGTTRYPASGTQAFTSAESNSKGFVRASTRDPRFLEFSNGQSFVPISSGHQWWKFGAGRSSDYENTFAEYAQYGINLTRIWDQNDSYALTVEGHFDAYTYPDDFNPQDRGIDINSLPKGTQMNQRGNYEEDRIIEAAQRNGVYLILGSHGDPFWIWDASVYTDSWNTNPVAFDNPAHLRYWQRNFRYRVARWGYSTAVMAWETWNEHGNVTVGSSLYNFYQQYGQYQTQADPYRHLRTTSQGSQAWSPGLWSSSAFDIASYHDYMMISRYPADLTYDAANFVYRFAQCLRTPTARECGLGLGDGSSWNGAVKPIFWGELDSGTTQWNQANINAKATHDMRWAGLFSPIGMAPIDWYWDQQSAAFIATKHAEAGIASRYFQGVDYAGLNLTFLSTDDVRNTSQSIPVSSTKLRVLALRAGNGTQAYAWVQNRDNARWDQGVNNSPLSATFTLNNMANGNYRVEIWDTYTGQVTDGGVVAAVNGAVTVQVNNLTKDVAVKIITTEQQPPTATPQPTATFVPPTPTLIPTATLVPPTETPLPTATLVPPTETPLPTATPVEPTLVPTDIPPTDVPLPTATPVEPTLVPTDIPPTDVPGEPTVVPTDVPPTIPPVSGNPELRLDVVPDAALPGETIAVQLNLYSVSNLYGLEAACLVDPTILSGATYTGGAGFNEGNSIFVDQEFQGADGSWRIATSRVNPNGPIEGDTTAFSLNYVVQAAGSTPIICSVLGVDANGRDVPLTMTNAIFDGTDTNLPPIEPTIPTPTPTLPPTMTPTPSATSSIVGVATIPGATDYSGITASIYNGDGTSLLAEVITAQNGSFQFVDAPVGSYILALHAPEALTIMYAIVIDTDGQVVDLGEVVMLMGDVDSNTVIDVQDAALVGANFGLDSVLVPNANLNRDTSIDIRDLVLIGANFGLIGPVTGQ